MTAEIGRCASCGDEADDLAPVRRAYVEPADWDTAGSATVLDDVELWCWSCRSMYPHEPANP